MAIKQEIVNKQMISRSLGHISHRIKWMSLEKKRIICRVIKMNMISKISNLPKEHSTMGLIRTDRAVPAVDLKELIEMQRQDLLGRKILELSR